MRIDVQLCPDAITRELRALHARFSRAGDCLYDLPAIAVPDSEFALRHRAADGEFYVYVEDLRVGRLAGYTIFNRLPEVGRRADRYLRAPHSRYDARYQRRGIATMLYRWALDAGWCLLSGARQSSGAAALWTTLSAGYPHGYVELGRGSLHLLGETVEPHVHDALTTRRLMFGRGWDAATLATAAGMRVAAEPAGDPVLPSAARPEAAQSDPARPTLTRPELTRPDPAWRASGRAASGGFAQLPGDLRFRQVRREHLDQPVRIRAQERALA
jgi:GNAT superfamily N-acetyltransferase